MLMVGLTVPICTGHDVDAVGCVRNLPVKSRNDCDTNTDARGTPAHSFCHLVL